MKNIAFIVLVFLCSGCGSKLYRETPVGEFSGDLEVRWIANDQFLFTPSRDNPLTFVRSNNQHVVPGVMMTDGGSVPRFLWGVKGLSPWGYAPAYMIHDWVFKVNICDYESDHAYEFSDSVNIMAETLKTVMENDGETKSNTLFEAIVFATSTEIAERIWNSGTCDEPEHTPDYMNDPGELIAVIRF